MSAHREGRTDKNNVIERTFEEMFGPMQKQTIEDMAGASETPRSENSAHLATSTTINRRTRDPAIVNFEWPHDPNRTPLLPPEPSNSFQELAQKMEAFADVVTRGDSLMVATDGMLLRGWQPETAIKKADAEGMLSPQELAEIHTIKKICNAAKARENQIRAELDRLKREINKACQILERRKRVVESSLRARRAAQHGEKRKWDRTC